jgi:anti-sigma regulatory factor (Ser/Thr protein kinase)
VPDKPYTLGNVVQQVLRCHAAGWAQPSARCRTNRRRRAGRLRTQPCGKVGSRGTADPTTLGTVLESQDFTLPHSSDAAVLARRIVEEQLSPLLSPARASDLRLLTTELVTNALRHSPPLPGGTIGLHVERDDRSIRVSVTDGGTHLDPDALTFHTAADGEFGMYFLDHLADGWGFSLDGVKGVWFGMDLP